MSRPPYAARTFDTNYDAMGLTYYEAAYKKAGSSTRSQFPHNSLVFFSFFPSPLDLKHVGARPKEAYARTHT